MCKIVITNIAILVIVIDFLTLLHVLGMTLKISNMSLFQQRTQTIQNLLGMTSANDSIRFDYRIILHHDAMK